MLVLASGEYSVDTLTANHHHQTFGMVVDASDVWQFENGHQYLYSVRR